MARRPGLALLTAGEGVNVAVANTETGVDLTITSDSPDEVRARVRAGVKALEAQAKQPGPAAGPQARRQGGLARLIASGDVQITTKDVENGVVVSFTSEKPETAQALQARMPEWIGAARERGERIQKAQLRWEKFRAALGLIATDEVKIEVKEADNGLVVRITSDDPAVAQKIKEQLTGYYKGQK
ncbi:MAG: hypothetical protein ACYS8L_07120, partial [Planctomycetota bacterium]